MRAQQNNKNLNDSRESIDQDLADWENQLPEHLRYHEEERHPQVKLFASMLLLGLQYVELVW